MKIKRIIISAICSLAVIAITIFLIDIYRNPFIYENDYYEKVGIHGSHLYNDLLKQKGEPKNISYDEDGKYESVEYDGLSFSFPTAGNKGVFLCVFVTGEQYRFGKNKIGVGSTRSEIEKAYGSRINTVDTKRTDEIAYVDGQMWVSFYFDEENACNKITFTYGGP